MMIIRGSHASSVFMQTNESIFYMNKKIRVFYQFRMKAVSEGKLYKPLSSEGYKNLNFFRTFISFISIVDTWYFEHLVSSHLSWNQFKAWKWFVYHFSEDNTLRLGKITTHTYRRKKRWKWVLNVVFIVTDKSWSWT